MKSRWIIYLIIGVLFGTFDYFYLEFLYDVPFQQFFGNGAGGRTLSFIVSFVILNLGIWLLPAVPVAIHEARHSRSRWRSTVATLFMWCVGIVAYYLTNAAQLAFLGVPGRQEVHISNYGDPHFWANWASVFRGSILGGITEWMMVAVVGGAIVGFLTSAIYLRVTRLRSL